jgi:hypothetical protein
MGVQNQDADLNGINQKRGVRKALQYMYCAL